MTNILKTEQNAGVIDISNISQEQINELRLRVTKFKGLIRVFVHPYYEEYDDSKSWRSRRMNNIFPRIEYSAKGLSRIISLPSARTPAVIVFEEKANLEKTKLRLEKIIQKSGNQVCIVPTHYNNSNPRLNKNYGDDWPEFRKIMKEVGVTRILIGGQRFIVEPGGKHQNSKGKKYTAHRCVGGAIDNLADYFVIEVSNLAHPHARMDVENVGPRYRNANMILNDDL